MKTKRLLPALTILATLIVGLGCAQQTTHARAPSADSCAALPSDARAEAERLLDRASLRRKVHSETVRGKLVQKKLAGVELYVASAPGVSEQWLQRVIECRIGELTSANDTTSPLATPGIRVQITPGRKGYFVQLTANERDAAAELVRRTEQQLARR